MDLKDLIKQLPSNVSGDGKSFVAGLKKILAYIKDSTDDTINEAIGSIGEGTVAQVTNVRATEYHTVGPNGNVNNVRVEWDNTNVDSYANAQVWVKAGVGEWEQKGLSSGVQYVLEDLVAGQTYYIKVVACNKNAGTSTFAEAPQVTIIIKGSVLTCPAPEQFYWSNERMRWEWSGYTDNGYTDFFEVRTDQNAGVWNEHRLDSVAYDGVTFYSTVQPKFRSGTAYLYVRNKFGEYNAPVSHIYNIAAPNAPSTPSLAATLDGVVITMDSLPDGCISYVVLADNVEYEVFTKQWTYYKFSGAVSVKYCFVDKIGRGEWSGVATLNVKKQLEADYIPTITKDKLDSTVNNALQLANSSMQQSNIDSALRTAQSYAEDAYNRAIGYADDIVTSGFDGDLKSYVKKEELTDSINTAVVNVGLLDSSKNLNVYTKTETSSAIETALVNQQLAVRVDGGIVSNVYTKAETPNVISTALSTYTEETLNPILNSYAATTTVNEQGAKINSLLSAVGTNSTGEPINVSSQISTAVSSVNGYTDSAIASYNTNTVSKTYATLTNLNDKEASLTSLISSYTKGNGYLIPSDTHAGTKSASAVGTVITKATSSYYWLAIYDVTPGEVYNVIVQTYATAIYHVVYTDDTDKIVAREGSSTIFYSTSTKYKNYDFIEGYVTIPSGATKMWITARANARNTQQDWSACIKVRRAGQTYSAITQAQEAIQLKVSTSDFTGDNLVSKINSAGITITGDKVAIDADHVNINGMVISGDNLKANAVTAAKIASNAVTADKISAGAITANKIAANAIQIGGANNNVTIQDGAINGSKIVANSITGDKVAANTIRASHLYGETIELSNNLAIAGGAVTLDSNGLHCGVGNGSVINFNDNGMSIQDSNGKVFSQIGRFAIGQVAHNEVISLGWDIPPKAVFLTPYSLQTTVSGYTSSSLTIKCFADNLSASGFTGKCYTTINSGSYAEQVLPYTSRSSAAKTITTTTQTTRVLAGSSVANISVTSSASGFVYNHYFDGQGEDTGVEKWSSMSGIYVDIYVNSLLQKTLTVAKGGDYHYSSYKYGSSYGGTVTTVLSVNENDVIGIRTRCECSSWDYAVTVEQTSATVTTNVSGDTVVSEGTATYFAIG